MEVLFGGMSEAGPSGDPEPKVSRKAEGMTDRWLMECPDRHAELTGIHLGDDWGEGGGVSLMVPIVAVLVGLGVYLCLTAG